MRSNFRAGLTLALIAAIVVGPKFYNDVKEELPDVGGVLSGKDLSSSKEYDGPFPSSQTRVEVPGANESAVLQVSDPDSVSPIASNSGVGVFSVQPERINSARHLLSSLAVAPKYVGDYDRKSQFGSWSDSAKGVALAGNGCDTRNDILARDLENVRKDGSCKVVSGTLQHDPYGTSEHPTDNVVEWKKGDNTIDIEHIVALENVWASGAKAWDKDKRVAIANDPRNLIAVNAGANRQKGSKDASEWMPANMDYHCQYIVTQIELKSEYGMSVTPAEKDVMGKVLDTTCQSR